MSLSWLKKNPAYSPNSDRIIFNYGKKIENHLKQTIWKIKYVLFLGGLRIEKFHSSDFLGEAGKMSPLSHHKNPLPINQPPKKTCSPKRPPFKHPDRVWASQRCHRLQSTPPLDTACLQWRSTEVGNFTSFLLGGIIPS